MIWFSTVVIVNIRDEDNYELKQTLRLSHLKVVIYSFIAVFSLFIISFILIKTVLASWFDPTHIRLESDKKMLSLSYQIDSLEQEINGRDLYLKSLQDVINGGVTTTDKIKDEQKTDTATSTQVTQVSLDHLSADELEIRKEFEDDDHSEPYSSNLNYGTLSQINFFTPVNGVITAKFDQKMLHYGVDIVAKTGSTIRAVAAGKVIMADWTKESGNVIIIQHKGSLISVYKHNSSLMKKVGSFVKAGEAIAVIGNSGELTTGPHLHLELWLGGNPINPQRYIPF